MKYLDVPVTFHLIGLDDIIQTGASRNLNMLFMKMARIYS